MLSSLWKTNKQTEDRERRIQRERRESDWERKRMKRGEGGGSEGKRN